MSAHTPGPWSRSWIYGAIRHLNKNVDYDAFWMPNEEEERAVYEGRINYQNVRSNPADADLIAAAPELLAALRELVAWCDERHGPMLETDRARAAIAAAEGQQRSEEQARNWHIRRDERNGRYTP